MLLLPTAQLSPARRYHPRPPIVRGTVAQRRGGARTSKNANCPQFTILHKSGVLGALEWCNASSEAGLAPLVVADRPPLGIFATFACYR